MSFKIIPFIDRVLIKRLAYSAKAVEKEIGGILVPTSENFDSVKLGEIISVNPKTNEKYEIDMEVGQKVILPEYGATQFNFEGDNFEMYKIIDLIGFVEDDDL